MTGQLWLDYRRLFGQDVADELCWQASSRTMNPSIPEAFVKAELEKDPAHASSEYLATFRTDIDNYIAREAVEAVMVPGPFELAYQANRRYVAGIDPWRAGLHPLLRLHHFCQAEAPTTAPLGNLEINRS
jgi:hypothetical protein